MKASLRAWRALAAHERDATRSALVALPLLRLGLRLFGYRRCHRWLVLRPLGKTVAQSDEVVCRACKEAVERIARRVPGGASCLPRSLCLFWLLRRRGVATALRIGVRRTEEGAIEGHAWIELDGNPVNDTANVGERFAPFEGSSLPEIPRITP